MIQHTSSARYKAALRSARAASPRIAAATSKPAEMPDDAMYYLSEDLMSGFGVTPDGWAIGLFSQVKGRGPEMVAAVIREGAHLLDCFDGFLPSYYEQFGFIETERVPNWTPGAPDVVFMKLASV
ncbi:hypothetical protein ABZ114_02945 [Streptomyces albidoflavus]|uniref:hypothetical protein n=1 Tax=Streptomyces albidoflavus TaxID=1886 RepID=UPI0033A44F7C